MSENDEVYAVAAAALKTGKSVSEQVLAPGVFHFPLQKAYLCENCHNVANISTVCPSCADTSSMVPLAGIVNPEELI